MDNQSKTANFQNNKKAFILKEQSHIYQRAFFYKVILESLLVS